jgi:hypothetical protein
MRKIILLFTCLSLAVAAVVSATGGTTVGSGRSSESAGVSGTEPDASAGEQTLNVPQPEDTPGGEIERPEVKSNGKTQRQPPE